MPTAHAARHSRLSESAGVVLWALAALLFACLLSYDALDPSWNVAASREVYRNAIGKFGSYAADSLFQAIERRDVEE